MAHHEPSAPDSGAQVVNFRRRAGTPSPGQGNTGKNGTGPGAVDDDLAKYARDDTPDDYQHRMIVNIAAFAFVVLLVGAGLWLADTMASMRKNQDCVLTGRRGCSPVEVPVQSRY
ncbi:hypothetical protein ASD45_11305 [Pseudolabrys sp. Root1462]|jgi:hypothetical protein|uniref:hypothetical protein n=1 Tax=Pseudolabrys sp. Root1462 TaxID=1736466 RepID=UPI000703AC27|nr:hypothetical protein [Pseudolabrys sp. Root1462]KQZ01370.1 hypothetical protein ASD45_11305 [Pseudolabrys sp. Root1462]HTJ02044.1 hypothetical protein [Methylovirgula sp.]